MADIDHVITEAEPAETDVAIVGMAGRFPGAPSPDALWRRVVAGDDCLTDFARDELIVSGVRPANVDDASYVPRGGVLDGVEMFDAGFFGVGQRDAALMDPQHRHFIECCWDALETAGHVPERFAGAIGVFAGCGMNTYLLNNLLTNPALVEQVGMFLLRHTANDKDFLTTTVSYKLDLRGPSVNVQTACSTSLVAIHLAVQSLLSFECDMALAGGVTIEVPHGVGYAYREGEILSPDGRCRAFDERSSGTVLTSGVGVVALRRLADAVADGDEILAVVKGSAVNNDGQRKVGYLAPSVDGHADVVKEALAVAGLSARDLQLLEAHGTGTAVGDPIEVAALTEAFRDSTSDTGFCRLVSTKPNIGHLDTAAGVASVIKVVQALRHRTLPPMANHTGPSPLLDIERTPFVLSDTATWWPGDRPRRAGISSLGVGGTNAHVILQEAPSRGATPAATGEQVVVLSGRSSEAVAALADRLADHLDGSPDENLADVAYTLATSRRAHRHRRVVVAPSTADMARVLRTTDRNRVATTEAPAGAPRVAFLLPGGGSQYAGMAAGLDERFGVFHETLAESVTRVRERSGLDLRPLLAADADADTLRHATAFMPAIFVTSVALARQWMAWGVRPAAFLGHSLGEYAAAHLAGVLTLDGAIDLITARAALMDSVSGAGGATMAVSLPERDVRAVLPASLSVATVNAADECTVAGPLAEVEALRDRLAADDVTVTVVPMAAAPHSAMLDPVLDAFGDAVRMVELSPPTMPYVSNLTGTWITAEQATDPQFWVDHLRNTVRFDDGLGSLLADGPTVLMEVGPGHMLSSLARRHDAAPVAAIPVLRHPNQTIDDTAYTLHAFARGWAAGVDVDVARFAGEGRHRVRLPGYPFAREPHWIAPGERGIGAASAASAAVAVATTSAAPEPQRIADLADCFWAPTWVDAVMTPPRTMPVGPWLIVGEPLDPLAAALERELVGRGATTEVAPSPSGAALAAARAVVLVGPTSGIDAAIERWLMTASAAARTLGAAAGEPTLLAAVTRGATAADGQAASPVDAIALGIVGTAGQEYLDLRTVLVDLASDRDVDIADDGAVGADAARVAAELFDASDRVVAWRGERRLVPATERTSLSPGQTGPAPVGFRTGGTYLVTGGLGGVGFTIAEYLARVHEANLVITSSRPVPVGVERSSWLAHHGYDDPTSRRLRRLAELEAIGTKVSVVVADLADPASIRLALDEAERHVTRLDGAVHAAGELRDHPIELATPEDLEVVVGAKARGAVTLVDELRRRHADLLVLVSSTSTVLMPEGQAAYIAANSVLDALAGEHDALHVRTMNFGLWADRGVAADTARRARLDIEPGAPVDHPVLTELSTDRAGRSVLVGTLATSHHWLVDEHRTASGVALLPGTGHLELMLAALQAVGDSGSALAGVTLLEPLVVPDETPVLVRVSIDAAAGTVQVDSDGGVGLWRIHSEARLAAPTEMGVTRPVPERPAGASDVNPLARPSAQLELGPRWSAVVQAWRDGDVVCGRLALPELYAAEIDAWRAHPALVDVATAFGVTLGERAESLYVPVGYDAVVSEGPLPDQVWVTASLAEQSTSDVLRVDVRLEDDFGRTYLRIDGLALRPIDSPAALAQPEPAQSEPDDAGRRVPALIALAARHGIRADEGPELLERLLASGRPRLIGSTIALDDLIAITAPVAVTEPSAPPADSARRDVAPEATSVVGRLRQIWVELLGVTEIGDDDDFFDLGGHSLIAIRLMSRVHKEFGTRFQLATIFEAPTISGLAARVREMRPGLDDEMAAAAALPSTNSLTDVGAAGVAVASDATAAVATHRSLVTISASGDKQPMFIVHGAGGNVLFLWSLARALAGSRPVYGFQAHGVDGADMPDATVEQMATRYVAELRAAHQGPYLLGGYSGGGIVAFEMVRQLEALGEEVTFVVLFDSVPPGRVAVPRGQQLRNLLANIRRHGFGPLRPYIRSRIKDSVQRFVPERRWRTELTKQEERDLGIRDVEDLGFVNLFHYFSAAADRYDMSVIHTDAAVLKAEWVWPIQPHDYHWGRFIDGELDIAVIPGNHNAMFYPENAPRLAEVLDEVLTRRSL